MLSKQSRAKPAERRKSSTFGHQTLSGIIPQDKRLCNWVVQVMKGWEENPSDYVYLYQKERIIKVTVDCIDGTG